MASTLRTVLIASSLFVGLGLAQGCECGGTETAPPLTSAVGGAGQGGAGEGGNLFNTGGNGGGCVSDEECDGGVCNNGLCCNDEDAVCGEGCCNTAGDVCLLDQCVTPGDDCVSEADCPDDHYCEPALGEESQGGAGPGCTQPLESGKCVPKPTVCTGEPSDPPDCVPPCEYVPDAGNLNAVVKWQWGHDAAPVEFPAKADVWSTPAVARIYDANCDGKVDLADPPNVVFVSNDTQGINCNATSTNGACKKGVLRMLDGKTGQEIWTLDKASPTSIGFAGVSVAIGDVDGDEAVDVVALTGEGRIAVVNRDGQVTHLSDDVVDGGAHANFGWGGGIALGDMDNDGWPEIAYGRTTFTMKNGAIATLFHGTLGYGGQVHTALSHFADLDGDGSQELVAGNTAYLVDGMPLWHNASVPDGFTATGDFDGDSLPEIVLIRNGNLHLLEGVSGLAEIPAHDIPGNGQGGPPTVADFNGDGQPEIGVAMQNFYSMMKPDYVNVAIDDLWSTPNHDNSSSVTGSSVFDFEGDGKAEVIYMDECFVWVYDGTTGDVLFTANSLSFTATEASIVADVDGDGHAEILVVHNGVNTTTWSCAHHTTGTDGYPVWSPPSSGTYRGVTLYGDVANSWVGTRTLWNQHAYSVSNVCDPRDSACAMGSYYGEIPQNQLPNWNQSWLNNFRQNVQDAGLFDAPDPVVSLEAPCADPVPLTVSVRNLGLSGLPAGVEVRIYRAPDLHIGTVYTSKALLAGQTEEIPFVVDPADGTSASSYRAEIYVDPAMPTFHECRPENNQSEVVTPTCVK